MHTDDWQFYYTNSFPSADSVEVSRMKKKIVGNIIILNLILDSEALRPKLQISFFTSPIISKFSEET